MNTFVIHSILFFLKKDLSGEKNINKYCAARSVGEKKIEGRKKIKISIPSAHIFYPILHDLVSNGGRQDR